MCVEGVSIVEGRVGIKGVSGKDVDGGVLR